jgi:hypothetical protein
MKKILPTIISAIFTTTIFAEEAKNSTYVDIGYTMLTYADSGTDFSPSAVRLIVGDNTSSNFGYEGMLGAGVASSSKTISGTSYKSTIPTFYGFYGKAFANLSNEVEVFVRLGWARFDRDITPKSTTSNTGSGLSYGVGANFSVSKTMNISADYMSYYPTKNSIGLSGYTIGAGFSF